MATLLLHLESVRLRVEIDGELDRVAEGVGARELGVTLQAFQIVLFMVHRDRVLIIAHLLLLSHELLLALHERAALGVER